MALTALSELLENVGTLPPILVFLLVGWGLWLKLGKKNNDRNDVQEKLSQDLIRINRSEKDIIQIWEAIEGIQRDQADFTAKVMSDLGEIKGYIKGRDV